VRLVIATQNAGKIKEFREILGGDRFQWDDLSAHKELVAPEETGRTFRANACLKASYYARALGAHALADDSGLEVDALAASPGVHSARWAEMHSAGKGDAANNALLLKQLNAVPDAQRSSRFVCVLALAEPSGRIIFTARDSVEGRVIHEARGNNGFGYDPLFLIDEMGKTTAELPAEEKHRISHRGKALRRLRGMMEEWGTGRE
jgi:XTP/dITP diphosphohydrolase